MTRVLLTHFNVNYDGDDHYVEGVIHSDDTNIESGGFIRTKAYGEAHNKVFEMLQKSWVKWDSPGYEPVPNEIYAFIGHEGKVFDLQHL